MSFEYTLKSHEDIGYSNWFKTIKSEYDDFYYNHYRESERLAFLNEHLKKQHARFLYGCTLSFDSKAHYFWFILKWT
jgi:hypothetical protein